MRRWRWKAPSYKVLKSYVATMVPNGTYQVSIPYHSCCYNVAHGHVCIRHLAHNGTQSIGTGLFGPCPRCPRPKEMSCRVCNIVSSWHFVLFCQLDPNPQHLNLCASDYCWELYIERFKQVSQLVHVQLTFWTIGPPFLSKTALLFTRCLLLAIGLLAALQLYPNKWPLKTAAEKLMCLWQKWQQK